MFYFSFANKFFINIKKHKYQLITDLVSLLQKSFYIIHAGLFKMDWQDE